MGLGPFDISAERITALGVRFTPFVNRLLDLEVRANDLSGHRLSVNINETTPDGGVDASVRGAPGSDYLPTGDSAWQFKRSGFGPKACADELEKATWAHDFVRGGGSYVIVIADALPDKLIERRRLAIAAKAVELGLLATDDRDRIRVYDANVLGRWASRFPSLAVSRLAGGPGSDAVDFETWAAGRTHTLAWTTDAARDAAIAAIRSQVSSTGVVEIRVQGDSGIGKTRLVLEALRDERLQPLVAYVADERAVGGDLLAHLVADGRTAVLVVDECPAERHIKLVERLPADPAIKLVTIGDAGPAVSRGPVIGVHPVDDETAEEFLKTNYPMLSAEARRFVGDHSRGNLRWTIVLAERVSQASEGHAAELIGRNDIGQFVADLLPEGRDFFCSALLALLERVGWDDDRRYQLELLASFGGVQTADLESAAARLAERGLLNKLGRYRAVTPHPLAVFLAAEGWRQLAERLVTDLLPQLDDGMALAFFRRVADLGRFEPATSVLPQLLAPAGPFGSLDRLAAGGTGRMLTQLAIVLPDAVALHLGELIEEAESEALAAQREYRRDLVWTLEKLAWHSRTFVAAADSLLKLALAENETYANNATGTWLDLFGTMLPGTAAAPRSRLEYLKRVSKSPDPDVRTLVVQAASRAFTHHESITVSGELQGGVLVEPRGTPRTWPEAGEYRNEMIHLLLGLASDPEPAIVKAAEEALVGAVHPLIDDPFSGEVLADALAELSGDGLLKFRAEAEHLMALYDRHDREDRKVRERLRRLVERLPEPSPSETVRVLSQLRRWDFSDGELQQRLADAMRPMAVDELSALLADLLSGGELSAAWELGYAVADVHPSDAVLAVLVDGFGANPNAVLGYLVRAQVENELAFEEFLGSDLGRRLALRDRVSLASHGPATDRLRQLVMSGLQELPVASAISASFGFHRKLGESGALALLDNWVERVDSQQDYNALVDWLNLVLHPDPTVPEMMRDSVWRLIELRRAYPNVGRETWDWSRLASGFAADRPYELGSLILDLVDSREVMLHQGDDQSKLLGECAATDQRVWAEIAGRLEGGSWLLQMELRGWFLNHVPPEVVDEWVGANLARARIVASIAPVGGSTPSPYARLLLDRFGQDDEVKSSLYGSLVTGFWTGNESDRIAGQIEQLNGWRASTQEPLGVRAWAREVVTSLEQAKQRALQREAEDHF
jgi:hypothetical protein